MKIYRIALVDDHRLFRSGIASLIETFPDYQVIFEASNGKEFCEKIGPALMPDIVILDLSMPVMDGVATAEWIKKNHPKIAVIVLSMHQDPEKVVALVRSGIKGYLLKDSEPGEFKIALDTVAADDIHFPTFVTRHLVNNYANSFDASSLNRRELEFIRHCASELTYREIAVAMGVSERTVDSYRDQAFIKINVKSRVGLVLYGIKKRIIEV